MFEKEWEKKNISFPLKRYQAYTPESACCSTIVCILNLDFEITPSESVGMGPIQPIYPKINHTSLEKLETFGQNRDRFWYYTRVCKIV